MWTESDIIAKSWLVKEVVSLQLFGQYEVDRIFLIGSYASGKQTDYSDLDFLIQLKGHAKVGFIYPSWKKVQEIHEQLGSRIHVIFGTEIAAKSLHEKHKHEFKNYAYRELKIQESKELV